MTEQRGVLVAYASRMGSTREIAEVIGVVLGSTGRPATVLPVDEVTGLSGYDVVVLGSALYYTRWRRAAARFLRRHRDELAHQDVWLFHSGPCGERDAARQIPLLFGVRRTAERIGAHPVVTFGGNLDPARAQGAAARRIARGELAGDWRDWDQIRTWAATVAARCATTGGRS